MIAVAVQINTVPLVPSFLVMTSTTGTNGDPVERRVLGKSYLAGSEMDLVRGRGRVFMSRSVSRERFLSLLWRAGGTMGLDTCMHACMKGNEWALAASVPIAQGVADGRQSQLTGTVNNMQRRLALVVSTCMLPCTKQRGDSTTANRGPSSRLTRQNMLRTEKAVSPSVSRVPLAPRQIPPRLPGERVRTRHAPGGPGHQRPPPLSPPTSRGTFSCAAQAILGRRTLLFATIFSSPFSSSALFTLRCRHTDLVVLRFQCTRPTVHIDDNSSIPDPR